MLVVLPRAHASETGYLRDGTAIAGHSGMSTPRQFRSHLVQRLLLVAGLVVAPAAACDGTVFDTDDDDGTETPYPYTPPPSTYDEQICISNPYPANDPNPPDPGTGGFGSVGGAGGIGHVRIYSW